MIVYYFAAICPKRYYKSIEYDISPAAYRFNRLLAQGLQGISGIKVNCFVPASIQKRLRTFGHIKIDNGVHYIFLNRKSYQRGIPGYIAAVRKDMKQNPDEQKIIICDSLSISLDITSIFFNVFYDIPNVGIVTDLPKFVGGSHKNWKMKCLEIMNTFLMRRFRNYVLLTQYMTEYINKRSRPQSIIEGISNIEDWKTVNTLENKYPKKICLYAGSLHREYGIDMLIRAFIRANVTDTELHIYGDGNYRKTIEKICKTKKNVFYFGLVSNDIILEEEKKATLLINPRPTNLEYVKYSFPSKTLEYMGSGTPLLTTRLPGMPKDYYEYVYFFQEETIEGYTDTLMYILHKSRGELHQMGIKAKEFILTTRNNRKQADKILKDLQFKEK